MYWMPPSIPLRYLPNGYKLTKHMWAPRVCKVWQRMWFRIDCGHVSRLVMRQTRKTQNCHSPDGNRTFIVILPVFRKLGCYMLNFGLSIPIAVPSDWRACARGLGKLCLKFGIFVMGFSI